MGPHLHLNGVQSTGTTSNDHHSLRVRRITRGECVGDSPGLKDYKKPIKRREEKKKREM